MLMKVINVENAVKCRSRPSLSAASMVFLLKRCKHVEYMWDHWVHYEENEFLLFFVVDIKSVKHHRT